MKKHPLNSPSPAFARATHTARRAKLRIFGTRFLVLAAASLACLPTAQGVILTVLDDAAVDDNFGSSVGISGTTAIVGAYYKDHQQGAAYLYAGVDSATPTQTFERLETSDVLRLGWSVGISGTTAIVGTSPDPAYAGAAYIYTGIGSDSPVETPLTYPGTSVGDGFGYSVGISGTTAIVGAPSKDTYTGAVYIYTEGNYSNPTQLPYSGAESDRFGYSVGISGTIAVVGALNNVSSTGAAYLYTGVESANPTGTQLTYSGAAPSDGFGYSVGIDGTIAIVGAPFKNSYTGAAYVYTGVDSGASTEIELTASDAAAMDGFGWSVGISGTTAIVGAVVKDGTGAAYFYTGVDSGSPTEVKLTASDGMSDDQFGVSVGIDGDTFIVGAAYAAGGVNTSTGTSTMRGGKAYTGRVSTFTTVNSGNVTRETAGLSFVSKTDWIIGDTTNNNTVILSKFNSSDNTNYGTGGAWYSDTADVTATGKAVYIGKSNGASGNKLIVEGDLRTNKIYIGSANGANNNTLIVSGNTLKGGTSGQIKADEIHIGSESSHGNVLKLEGDLSFVLTDPTTILLHQDNMLIIKEVHVGSGPGGEDLPLAPTEVVATLELKTIQLKAGWLTEGENLVSTANAEQLISTSTRADMPGYTIVRAAGGETPEPSTYALWGSGLLAGLVFLRHRRRRKG